LEDSVAKYILQGNTIDNYSNQNFSGDGLFFYLHKVYFFSFSAIAGVFVFNIIYQSQQEMPQPQSFEPSP